METHTKEEGHVPMEAEIGVRQLQAKELRKPPAAQRRAWTTPSPHRFQEDPMLPTS